MKHKTRFKRSINYYLKPVWKGLIFFGLAVFVVTANSFAETQEKKKAEYVGTQACASCHEDKAKKFEATTHGRIFIKDKEAEHSCELCHGMGSIHADKLGEKGTITKEDYKACGACHAKEKMNFSLQYHHPVPEGRMNCSSCHDIHGSATKRPSVKQENENCLSCHQQFKGPYVFEHSAMEDGCKVCHSPHGSINPKMLTEQDYNLCLKCHYSALQYQKVGHYAHKRALNPGKFGAKCTGCHRGSHGSNFSKELRTE